MRFGAQRGMPVEIRAMKHVLRWAPIQAEDEAWLVTTRDSIAVVTPEATEEHLWCDCEGASWDGDRDMLTVRFMDPSIEPFVVRIPSLEDAAIALVVRERLEGSIVYREQRALPSGAVAKGLVRRGPRGVLFTQVYVDGAVEAADEPEMDALDASMRDVVGLPVADSSEGALSE